MPVPLGEVWYGRGPKPDGPAHRPAADPWPRWSLRSYVARCVRVGGRGGPLGPLGVLPPAIAVSSRRRSGPGAGPTRSASPRWRCPPFQQLCRHPERAREAHWSCPDMRPVHARGSMRPGVRSAGAILRRRLASAIRMSTCRDRRSVGPCTCPVAPATPEWSMCRMAAHPLDAMTSVTTDCTHRARPEPAPGDRRPQLGGAEARCSLSTSPAGPADPRR
jgi:hypothetical protein